MSTDAEDLFFNMAMQMRLTAAQMRVIAGRLERARAGTTLGEVIEQIERRTGQQVAGSYPQGRRAILDGRAGVEGVVDAVPGFAGLPVDEFTTSRVKPLIHRIRLISAAGPKKKRETTPGKPRKAHGRSASGRAVRDGGAALGWGAARQYVWAVQAFGKTLVENNVLLTNPVAGLVAPKLPGPTREPSLTDQEMADYARVVLARSRDPVLDATMFALFRTTGMRKREMVQLPLTRTDAAAGRITVFGKGSRNGPVAVSRPLLARARALHRTRCPACGGDANASCPGTLLVTEQGARVGVNHVNEWSTRLHEACAWAHGHRIQVHVFRHTLARLLRQRYGGDSVVVTLFLRHSLAGHGTAARYMHSVYTDEWDVRVAAAEAVFGSLDEWPELPEWSLLAPWIVSAPEGEPR